MYRRVGLAWGAPETGAGSFECKIAFDAHVQFLLKQDRLLLDPSEGERDGTPYVAGDDGAVWPLCGDLLAVKGMLSQAGLNAEEPTFRWLVEHLQATAFNDGPRVTLAHFWTRYNQALYVSSGPTRMVKAGVWEVGLGMRLASPPEKRAGMPAVRRQPGALCARGCGSARLRTHQDGVDVIQLAPRQ